MKNEILKNLSTECPWRDTLYWYDTIDSTNVRIKQLAKEGAPQGTVVIAGGQTGGRGRLGRSFSSPAGQGVYLSALLRPACRPEKLMHLTCAVAVAMCRAIARTCGVRPGIKWTNDLVYGQKKLGGILTEVSVDSRTGLLEYAIVGVGVNCLQRKEDFPEELQDMAASLTMVSGKAVSPGMLAAAMTEELYALSDSLLTQKKRIMENYKENCITLGKDVVLVRGEEIRYGRALDLDDSGGLVVDFGNGDVRTVSSGEVSVRGMYGYL